MDLIGYRLYVDFPSSMGNRCNTPGKIACSPFFCAVGTAGKGYDQCFVSRDSGNLPEKAWRMAAYPGQSF